MFARRLINGGGRVSFDRLDRAAKMTETVEESQEMWKWVRDNNKQPQYFSGWSDVIAEYHAAVGTRWVKNYAVPSPYGFMGYDIIKPKLKSGLVVFKPTTEKEGCSDLDEDDWNTDDFIDSDDDDEEDESDWNEWGAEEDKPEEKKEEEKTSNELPPSDEINFSVVSNLFADSADEKEEQPLHKSVDGEDNDTLLSEVSSLEELSDSDDEEVFLEDCDYKCGILVDPADKTSCVCLHSIGGNYAHSKCHDKAKAKGLTLADIPKDTNIRDLPEGTRLEDLPRGAVITINESDIEWGSEIEISDDEEEDDNVANLEKAISENKVAVRACKCGSHSHRRTNHKSCPLNKKNKA